MGQEVVMAAAGVRGLAELEAAVPGVPYGPFADVVTVSSEVTGLYLHLPGCSAVPGPGRRHDEELPVPAFHSSVPPGDLPALAAVLNALPTAIAGPAPLMTWCPACALTDDRPLLPYGPPALLRATWMSLVHVAGQLAVLQDRVDRLAKAAGPDRTWPVPVWAAANRRPTVEGHELVHLVDAHQLHPGVRGYHRDEDAVDVSTRLGAIRLHLEVLRVSGGTDTDADVTELEQVLAWVEAARLAQERQVRQLLDSFPVCRLARRALQREKDVTEVLVLARPGSQVSYRNRRTGSGLEMLMPVLFANDAVMVLRVPEPLVPELGQEPFGVAPVPTGLEDQLGQAAQVAATAAQHHPLRELYQDKTLFPALVDAAAAALR